MRQQTQTLSTPAAKVKCLPQIPLLDRISRHVDLTDAGTEFPAHAERVLAAADQALAAVTRQATVRLGFSWLMPDPRAQDTMAAFTQSTGRPVQLARCRWPSCPATSTPSSVASSRRPWRPPPRIREKTN
jgi:hypothetical protein